MNGTSVIMPAYNAERFIGDAVESVRRQTSAAWELIVIDDGSIDRTADIVENFSARDPERIRLFRQSNRGPGAARNAGMEASRGKYLAFLDADDIWRPDKLARQIEALERNPAAGMIYCDNYFVDGERTVIPRYVRTVPLLRGNIAAALFEEFFIITSAVVVRREAAAAAGRFREDIRVAEDYDYFLRVAERFPVEVVPDKLYERRVFPGSLSRQDPLVDARNDLSVLDTFIRRNPVFARTHRKAVARRFARDHFLLGYLYLVKRLRWQSLAHLARSLRYRVTKRGLKYFALGLAPSAVRERVLRSIS